MKRTILFVSVFFVLTSIAFANSAPSVNVTVNPRTDGSGIVDIYYTLSDADNDHCTVSIEVSDDGGSSWNITATSLLGDIGENISCGNRHITWGSKYGTNYRIKVIADDGIVDIILITWVSITDPGFNGQMSKYETTNAQYCEFLNAALASGDIFVTNNIVYGANGSNSGADFVGKYYFRTYAAYSESQITYSGVTFSVRSRDGYDMSNHPVVGVNWYGATAFCNYYGYRLPTELEWQAVADHHGEFTYGCGTTIDSSKANYNMNNPLSLSSYPYTSPVGYYDYYGYGLCDMAGDVWEWTSTVVDEDTRIGRGGGWNVNYGLCTVSYRASVSPYDSSGKLGFRVCRDQ